MGKKNLYAGLQQCDFCSFSSKNLYIFKRHKIRCKREHVSKSSPQDERVTKETDDPLDETIQEIASSSEVGNQYGTGHESGPEMMETDTSMSLDASKESSDLEPGSSGKEKPAVNRNYQCSKCDFKTRRSRAFLHHLVEVHNSKFDIFSCKVCEYCSRYRHKMQRHMKFAHNVTPNLEDIDAEYICEDKARPVAVTKPKAKPTSGKGSGKKLMVKFVKPQNEKGSSVVVSNPFSSKGDKSGSKKSPAAQGKDQLSRVVEEVSGTDGATIYKCKECQFTNEDKQKVAKHAVSWHVDTKSFNCTYCDYITFERNDFLAHRISHRNQHMYKCEECLYSTDFRPNYDRHMNSHKGGFPFKCSFCTYGCGSDAALRRHMSANHDPMADVDGGATPHESSFSFKDIPTSPRKARESKYSHSSNQSLSTPPSKSQLLLDPSSASMVPRPTLPMPDVPEGFGREVSPSRKLNVNITQYVERENEKLVCPVCKLSYKRSSDLNRHMKRKHGCRLRDYLETYVNTSMDSDVVQPSQSDSEGSFTEEGHTSTLVEEMDDDDDNFFLTDQTSDDTPLTPEQLKCKFCSFQAKWPSDLRRHYAVHSIERRYKCNFCPRKYKYIGDMNLHIRKDHNKEPGEVKIVKVATIPKKKTSPAIFKCPCCEYTSAWKSEVDRHSRLHTGDKTFQCLNCDYQTFWRGDIRRHVYKHHPDIMKEGVAIDDVISIKKVDPSAEVKAGNNISSASEPGDADDNDSQPQEQLNTAESKLRRDTGHSPTPSPIKELGGGMYKCTYCGFVANAPSKMNCHIATHTNLKRYMCPLCGKRANWKWDISKHIRSHHGDKEAEVIKLSKAEAEKTIQQYMEVHPVVKRDHHLNAAIEKAPVPETMIKYFKCSACDYSAEKRISVNRHIRYMHDGQDVNIKVIRKPKKQGNSLKGLPAPKKIPSSDSVKSSPSATVTSQNKAKSGETPENDKSVLPYMCSECGRRGATKGDIKKHYHYAHADKEICIIYLGDGTKSVYNAKSSTNTSPTSSIQLTPKSSPPPSSPGSDNKRENYIKQFKCSQCGRRSNWKWDLAKHIRQRHPNKHVEIITMSEDEAKATLKEYTETDLQLLNKMVYSMAKEGQGLYKCSRCSFKSKRRSGVQKHISQRHGPGKAKIIILEEALNISLEELKGQPDSKPDVGEAQGGSELVIPTEPLPKEMWAGLEKRLWKCSMCPYSHNEKIDVLKHLSVHNMKAYRCTVCNWTSNLKSAVRKHLQTKHAHNGSAACRLSIKLLKEGPGVDQSGQAIMPEGMQAMNMASSQPGSEQDDTSQTTGGLGPKKLSGNELYQCKLCKFNSSWRSCVVRHIRRLHNSNDYTNLCQKINMKTGLERSISVCSSPVSDTSFTRPIANTDFAKARPKKFACTICPYRSHKSKMLKFHLTCHKPQPGVKQVKCKYCPYYVNGNRLLVQHTNLHLNEFRSHKSGQESKTGGYPVTPVKKNVTPISRSPATPKRHKCEKCPYTTNSKNDFLYHKQFHRPKPTADFKCDYCDYWVTHKRLLKQHLKVHEDDANYVPEAPTPTKSDYSENSLVYDTVEIAAIKQRIIASKITASISQTPLVSPMKIASSCSVGGRRGFLRKDGSYRKIHKCRLCPYMNIRLRNMKLHELMHGRRSSSHPLMKCPHCDYFVGSKGLLAHHLKVHQADYGVDFLGSDKERSDSFASEDSEIETPIAVENKVDTLLEIAKFKKFGCEKCPYASSKRSRFQKHVELHGSRQKYKCDYCDYSVPTTNLLSQHKKLHLEPNQNLLAAQSILNLQFLPEMPADVALASMMTNNDSKHPVSITHDHVELYENAPEDSEPKKIYRCDRCPYANIRRDHLLAHLRCHMIKHEYTCPYCDYSVGKTHVLVQHVKVHFSPLPELSEWLTETGDTERIKEIKGKNLKEAIHIVKLLQEEKQNQKDTEVKGDGTELVRADGETKTGSEVGERADKAESAAVVNGTVQNVDNEVSFKMNNDLKAATPRIKVLMKEDGTPADEDMEIDNQGTDVTVDQDDQYVCQYCDREFSSSDLLVRHEMQHLIGNSYEDLVKQLPQTAFIQQAAEDETSRCGTEGNSDPVPSNKSTSGDDCQSAGDIAMETEPASPVHETAMDTEDG